MEIHVREDIHLALVGAIADVCCEEPMNQLAHICKYLEGYADAKDVLVSQMVELANKYAANDEYEKENIMKNSKMLDLCTVCDKIRAIKSIENLSDSLSSLLPDGNVVYLAKIVELSHMEVIQSNVPILIGKKIMYGKGVWCKVDNHMYIPNIVFVPEIEYMLSYPKIASLFLLKLQNFILVIEYLGKLGIPQQVRDVIKEICITEIDKEMGGDTTEAAHLNTLDDPEDIKEHLKTMDGPEDI